MARQDLPTPATAVDMYLHDMAISLRGLNDLFGVIAQQPEPQPAPETVELREPAPTSEVPKSTAKRKASHRDELQAQDAAQPEPDPLDLPVGDHEGDAHALDPRDIELPPVNLQEDTKPRRRAN